MTDEEKRSEIVSVKKHGECCCYLFCKFLMITSAVFVGTLLAFLVSKALMRPAFPPCPCMMKGYGPGIQRQLPPPAEFGERPHHRHYLKSDKPKFDKDKAPKPEKID